ncbi:methyl-accepting chemotaxis protein [Roseomonas sp. SSH11]|uniref:Methyl-accepting chemotaxis protein n=1 Tax=Pararoseomonas baculiformis TaxID=2820812 RepID=A0ABS4AK47_9PROT|nr:methyl-accepting chemotaxis protein [Pararoseomonas baculiformis]MBP0447396.1 methyl-accepting chemotaxis protein [Pararoseomonas baculiformis]
MKIRSSLALQLGSLIGLLCFPLVGGSTWLVVRAAQDLQKATTAVEIADATRTAFVALQATRVERGPVRTALRAEAPAGAELMESAGRARAAARPALDALEAICARITCASNNAPVQLAAARRSLEAVRSEADPATSQPLARRPSGIADRYSAAATKLVELLEEISTTLTAQVRGMDGLSATLAQVKDAAYATRDAAGLERDYLLAAITRRAVPSEDRTAVTGLRTRVSATWPLVTSISAGLPQNMRNAIDSAQEGYFGRFVAMRDDVYRAAVEGRESPVSVAGMNRALDEATNLFVEIADGALATIGEMARHRAADATVWLVAAAVTALTVLALGVCIILIMRHRVGRPLGRLRDVMLKLALREYAFQLPDMRRQDEIGEMARAVATCRDGLREADALSIAQADEERIKAERASRVDALVRDFDVESADVLRSVAAAATELDATASAMAGAAQDGIERATSVAAAAEQASANVQTVAASAEEFAASIAEINRQVSQATTVASRAVQDARQTDTTVKSLAEGAARIGDVVRLISGIAGQTNLLALNATIEAARAGEAGRGFAVVASEVKTLAAQTAKATEEIASQIAEIQSATEQAVSAIRSIGCTIEEVSGIAVAIAATVEEQTSATGEIGRAAAEAAMGTQDVSRHTSGVTDGAQRTGAAASQVRAASSELAQQAEVLRGRMDRFLNDIRVA